MYVPILNSKEKARELIDVVREQTDAPIRTCINTVSIILSSLLRDLPDVYSLHIIKNDLENDDLIDVDNCYDAEVLKQLIASITSYIEDKCQLDWSIRDDEAVVVKSLQQFSGFLKKADIRVPMKRFRQDDYAFIEQLVSLYQMVSFHPETVQCRSGTEEISTHRASFNVSLTLFVGPFSHNNAALWTIANALNLEFLTKIVSIIEDFADAFQFILSFNVHFESNESTVIQALHKNPPPTFGQLLTVQLNLCRADSKDLRAVKLLMDIFCVSDELIAILFYDNDLKVLYGILCQDLIDTNETQKMAMILQIMTNMEVIKRCGLTQEVYASVKTFLLIHETELELRHCAESILQQVTKQQTNLPLAM
ncbi:unnamed protein product [Litomosoides sigmodontis]|uniref:SPIN90/Ldb17 leucine-rich domain-containing protein n=1 Tax=Litomosoides sigmodontis TaxID=42156 RepID=A0A3P6TZV4_LITSI|nr:unnamed protein product [Litomosoides sigmodontis]